MHLRWCKVLTHFQYKTSRCVETCVSDLSSIIFHFSALSSSPSHITTKKLLVYRMSATDVQKILLFWSLICFEIFLWENNIWSFSPTTITPPSFPHDYYYSFWYILISVTSRTRSFRIIAKGPSLHTRGIII